MQISEENKEILIYIVKNQREILYKQQRQAKSIAWMAKILREISAPDYNEEILHMNGILHKLENINQEVEGDDNE